jgi:hypothetical protein
MEFSKLPLQERIKLTKQSIIEELESYNYEYPKNVNINTKYMLEILEFAEENEQLEKQNNLLVEDYKQIVNIMLWMFRRQPKANKESVYKDLKNTIVNKALLDFKELMK